MDKRWGGSVGGALRRFPSTLRESTARARCAALHRRTLFPSRPAAGKTCLRCAPTRDSARWCCCCAPRRPRVTSRLRGAASQRSSCTGSQRRSRDSPHALAHHVRPPRTACTARAPTVASRPHRTRRRCRPASAGSPACRGAASAPHPELVDERFGLLQAKRLLVDRTVGGRTDERRRDATRSETVLNFRGAAPARPGAPRDRLLIGATGVLGADHGSRSNAA